MGGEVEKGARHTAAHSQEDQNCFEARVQHSPPTSPSPPRLPEPAPCSAVSDRWVTNPSGMARWWRCSLCAAQEVNNKGPEEQVAIKVSIPHTSLPALRLWEGPLVALHRRGGGLGWESSHLLRQTTCSLNVE